MGASHQWVLRGVNFAIQKGESIGILGRNGAGKSTLIRILADEERPTHGRVTRTMSVSWPLGGSQGIQTTLTGADNVKFLARIYGLAPKIAVSWAEEFADIGRHFRLPVSTYSSGMRARLLLTMALLVEFDCYLIDEGLATGDAKFAEKCHQALRARLANASVILVSHNPELVRRMCSHAVILHEGSLKECRGLDDAITQYKAL